MGQRTRLTVDGRTVQVLSRRQHGYFSLLAAALNLARLATLGLSHSSTGWITAAP